MTPTELYLFLFADSFITGLALPAKQAIAFPAMRIFGGYNLYIAGFVVTIAITLAAFPNWVLGRILRSLKKNNPEQKSNTKFEKIISILKTHGYWVGLLGFVPVLGPLLVVFSGLVQTNILRVTGLVFAVNMIYYGVIAFV